MYELEQVWLAKLFSGGVGGLEESSQTSISQRVRNFCSVWNVCNVVKPLATNRVEPRQFLLVEIRLVCRATPLDLKESQHHVGRSIISEFGNR